MANEIPGEDVRVMLSLQISGGNQWLERRNKSIPPESNPMSFSKERFFKAPWLNTIWLILHKSSTFNRTQFRTAVARFWCLYSEENWQEFWWKFDGKRCGETLHRWRGRLLFQGHTRDTWFQARASSRGRMNILRVRPPSGSWGWEWWSRRCRRRATERKKAQLAMRSNGLHFFFQIPPPTIANFSLTTTTECLNIHTHKLHTTLCHQIP